MSKPLENMAKRAINEQGRKVVEHPTASNRNAPNQEAHMADKPNMGIPPSKSISTWKSIGDLARELAEKAKAAAHE